MDEATQRYLNELNQEFYRATADEFSASRQGAWQGWERMLDAIDLPLDSVLDIGCGNGRLARFLAGRQERAFVYTGIDNCAELLAQAKGDLAGLGQARVNLLEQDLLLDGLEAASSQLVVLFGLLHHVPGRRRRLDLVQRAAEKVLPGGWLVFAAWRFYEKARFRERIAPWPAGLKLERHDYLLDWRRGQRALRYCHYIDDCEHAELIAAANLRIIADYRADGREGDLNRYTILSKP